MDLLFKRYANPYLILDEVIEQERLVEFVYELDLIKQDEKIFDIWLHKIYDKDYVDYKESCMPKTKPKISNDNLEAAVKNSKEMLINFVPS